MFRYDNILGRLRVVRAPDSGLMGSSITLDHVVESLVEARCCTVGVEDNRTTSAYVWLLIDFFKEFRFSLQKHSFEMIKYPPSDGRLSPNIVECNVNFEQVSTGRQQQSFECSVNFKTAEYWSAARVVLDVAMGQHVAVDVTTPTVCSLAIQMAAPRSRRQEPVDAVALVEIRVVADGETVAVFVLEVSEEIAPDAEQFQ